MWEKKWRERESKTLTREKSHSNEIGSIWKVCFSGAQMHIDWPHLMTDHQSETERAREGRETAESHMKAAWDYIFHFSTAILNHQNHLRSKSSTCFFCFFFFSFFRALLSGFYLRHFVLIEKGITLYLECNLEFFFFLFVVRQEMMLRSQQLSISSSVTAYFDIFGHDKREMMTEGGWGEAGRAAVSLLTHVDAWVQKRKKMKKIQIPCCKKNCTVCFIPGKLRVRPRKNRKRTPRAI